MTDDDNLSDLREQSRTGSRLDEDAQTDSTSAFQATVQSLLADIERGDRRKTMSIRDDSLTAFLAALEEHDDLRQRVGGELSRALGRDPADDYDRSTILRLLARVGLRESDPGMWNALAEAQAEHAKRSL